MALFHYSDQEEFLLFVRNFNMNLKASGNLETAAKVKCHRKIVSGESLHQFDTLSLSIMHLKLIKRLHISPLIKRK